MDYLNIFIIIFGIDIFIFIAEVIVYYAYTEPLLKKEANELIKSKLQFLTKNLNLYSTEKKTDFIENDAINNYKANETTYIKQSREFSLICCITFIVGLFILIGLYIWVVRKQFKIDLNYKYSIIVILTVVIFIILLEVSSIFLTLLDYMPNYMDLSKNINDTLRLIINQSFYDDQTYKDYLMEYDDYISKVDYGTEKHTVDNTKYTSVWIGK